MTVQQNDSATTWQVTMRNGTRHMVKAETWSYDTEGRAVEFSSGGNSCAAWFSLDEIESIIDRSDPSAVSV